MTIHLASHTPYTCDISMDTAQLHRCSIARPRLERQTHWHFGDQYFHHCVSRQLADHLNGTFENTTTANKYVGRLAERKGFEPSMRFPPYSLSRGAPSATRPPLRQDPTPRPSPAGVQEDNFSILPRSAHGGVAPFERRRAGSLLET